jgi:ADP-heptose:LPS heptosyltransferase
MVYNWRKRFYAWRQQRPLKRFVAAVAFVAVWPVCWFVNRLQRFGSRTAKTRRILAIHFGGLGDTLMLTPALRALKEHYPAARVELVTLHEHVREAFRDHSRIDSITTLPPYSGQFIVSRFTNLSDAGSVVRTVRYYPELLLKLLFRRYDLAINFGAAEFDQQLGNALMCCLDIPTRVGAAAGSARFLTHRVEISASRHRVDSYLDFVTTLGIHEPSKAYEYAVGTSNVRSIEQFLKDQGINQSARLAVIHPGGKLHVNSRRWPAGNFARVCDFLAGEGFQVLLAGDRDDSQVCDEVARLAKRQTKSVAGLLNFSETAALLSSADLTVTNDTATLHLADAVSVPCVVSIFGPTDPTVLAPQNERHIVFRSSLPCAPCMGGVIDARTERCWRDVKEECLSQTTPDQVVAVLRDVYRTGKVRAANA